MFYLLTAVFFVLLFAVIHLFLSKKSYWKNKGVNCQQYFFLSDFVSAKSSFIQIYSDFYNKFTNEPVVGLLVGLRPLLLIRDPVLVKHILATDFHVFHSHGIVTDPKGDFLSDNVLFMEGKRWKIMRQHLSPSFTPEKLKRMTYLISECSNRLEKYLEELLKTDDHDIISIVTDYTTSVITACALGVDSKTLTSEDSVFRRVGRDFFDMNIPKRIIITLTFLLPWIQKLVKPNIFKSSTHEFPKVFEEILKLRMNAEPRQDFTDLCLKLKKQKVLRDEQLDHEIEVTDKLLAAQAFFFYLAGFDTSSVTMSFVLYELARNPNVLNKLLKEIDEIMLKYKAINYESLEAVSYLEKVINETLRLHPPIGFIERMCYEDKYRFPGTDITLSKGDKCVIPIFALHRDGQYYENPEKFDPERDNISKENNYIFLAFGGGPRVCLGQRMAKLQLKAGLITILKDYLPECTSSGPVEYVAGFIALKPKKLNLRLVRRRDVKK